MLCQHHNPFGPVFGIGFAARNFVVPHPARCYNQDRQGSSMKRRNIFDPFGAGFFRYTFENRCLENTGRPLGDGCRCIFLNTRGEKQPGISEELIKFLRYVKADLHESLKDFQDAFIVQLQRSVQRIKTSRTMEERFMTLEELLRGERKAGEATGKAEGMARSILLLLEDRGTVPDPLLQRILSEKDMEILSSWLRLAAAADSVSQFEKSI